MRSRRLGFEKTDITWGFYHEKQALIKRVTLRAVYERFRETGRIGAFDMKRRDGDPNPPHIFRDPDVAKRMEAAA